jgi:hypothetical protein
MWLKERWLSPPRRSMLGTAGSKSWISPTNQSGQEQERVVVTRQVLFLSYITHTSPSRMGSESSRRIRIVGALAGVGSGQFKIPWLKVINRNWTFTSQTKAWQRLVSNLRTTLYRTSQLTETYRLQLDIGTSPLYDQDRTSYPFPCNIILLSKLYTDTSLQVSILSRLACSAPRLVHTQEPLTFYEKLSRTR